MEEAKCITSEGKAGMKTLTEDGLVKVRADSSSLEEVQLNLIGSE